MNSTPGETDKQRTDEWATLDASSMAYHLSQWRTPKRSTECFEQFASDRLATSKRIVDLGCGAGAATAFIARRHATVDFIGIDYSSELVAAANELSRRERVDNVRFQQADWFHLDRQEGVDAVISLQTLSWLPQFEVPMQRIYECLNPKWIALSSLFYDGDITCRIEIEEHRRQRKTFYNTYSLPAFGRHAAEYGYSVATAQKFVIDFDLPVPEDNNAMSTYTVRTDAARPPAVPDRLQVSGPLLMNWYFVVIEKTQ